MFDIYKPGKGVSENEPEKTYLHFIFQCCGVNSEEL